MDRTDLFGRAAAELRRAGALVVTAGAGMGVDSGLPDFRGDHGFWKAYPPYEKLGLSFVDAANPAHFDQDPQFGWGFYGHRTNLYRATVPHRGFALLLGWAERFRLPFFAVTSNVDGQFQKAGFPEDRVLEVHGSIHHLQCTTPCSDGIWTNGETFEIDLETMRSRRSRAARTAAPSPAPTSSCSATGPGSTPAPPPSARGSTSSSRTCAGGGSS